VKQIVQIVILLSMLWGTFVSVIMAQTTVSVLGYVRDAETRESLPYATILFLHQSGATTTNRFGFFSFQVTLQDTVTLRVSYVGYHVFDTTFVVGNRSKITIEVFLKQKTLSLEGVEVVGKSSFYEKSFPSTILMQQKQISSLPTIGEQDLFRGLQRLPGITFSSEISNRLYIRGGTPDQILTLWDGMAVYNLSHLFGFFSPFNLDAVAAVKVFKGGFPAEYGMRNGSVIDIFSREGNKKNFGGKASIGLITSSMFLNGPVGRGSWMISARRSYFDLITSLLAGSGDAIPKYYFYDVHAKLSQDMENYGQLKATLLYNKDKLSSELSPNSKVEGPVFTLSNQLFGVEWRKPLSSSSYMKVLGSFSRYRSILEPPKNEFVEPISSMEGNDITFDNSLADHTAKLELESQFARDHFVTVGLFYTHYDVSYSAKPVLTSRRQKITSRYGLLGSFIQDKFQLNDDLTVTPGLRVTTQTNEASIFVEPRLVLSYQLRPTLLTQIGAGLYNQWLKAVQPASFLSLLGVDLLFPIEQPAFVSRALQGSGEIVWFPYPMHSITVGAYVGQVSNVVELKQDFEESTNFAGMLSKGTGWNSGVEVFVERSSGSLRGAIGYTLSWALRRFDNIDQGKLFPARHDKRHEINVFGTVQLSETWSLSFGWNFSSGQAHTGIAGRYVVRPLGFDNIVPPAGSSYSLLSKKNAMRLPAYHRLDMSVTKTFKFEHWDLRCRLDVFNVYNRRNAIGGKPDFSIDGDPYARLLPIIPTLTIEAEF
jgi:hypothetical protein